MLPRKCIGLLLSLLLLVSQSGLALNVHFCGGEVASAKIVSPFSQAKSCCGKADRKPMGCCSEKVVKADSDQKSIVKNLSFDFVGIADFPATLTLNFPKHIPTRNVATPAASGFQANGPPLYLLFGQHLFYA